MCVCVCVCVCACLHVCICVYQCMCVCEYVCVCACMCVCVHTCVDIRICMCAFTIHVCVHACVNVYVYKYRHACSFVYSTEKALPPPTSPTPLLPPDYITRCILLYGRSSTIPVYRGDPQVVYNLYCQCMYRIQGFSRH